MRGKTRNKRGYIRVTAGPYRDWYEHRARMFEMLKNPISFNLSTDSLEGRMVHHVDGNCSHNCDGNLMLMDRALHDGTSQKWREHARPLTKEEEGYINELAGGL